MNYYTHMFNEKVHVHMEGRFTFRDYAGFVSIVKFLKSNDASEIHIFMNKLESLDLTALRFMMTMHDLAKKMERCLIFVQPKGQVKQMLYGAAQYNMLNIAA